MKPRPLSELLEQAQPLFQMFSSTSSNNTTWTTETANYVREQRTALGLSQTDLASALGTSQAYVSQVENRKRSITPQTLGRFYDTFQERREHAEAEDGRAEEGVEAAD